MSCRQPDRRPVCSHLLELQQLLLFDFLETQASLPVVLEQPISLLKEFSALGDGGELPLLYLLPDGLCVTEGFLKLPLFLLSFLDYCFLLDPAWRELRLGRDQEKARIPLVSLTSAPCRSSPSLGWSPWPGSAFCRAPAPSEPPSASLHHAPSSQPALARSSSIFSLQWPGSCEHGAHPSSSKQIRMKLELQNFAFV